MKPTTVINLLTLSCATAAAIPVVFKKDFTPRRESSAGLSFGTTFQLLSEVLGQKAVKTQQINISKSQPIPLDDAVPSPEKGCRPKYYYVASLTHRLIDKSPFSGSSIVSAETRASRIDGEPEAAMVEAEITGGKESYIQIPSFPGNAPDYEGVQIHADVIVVSLVLIFIAVVLITELWNPVAARISCFRSGHGPIYLDAKEGMTRDNVV